MLLVQEAMLRSCPIWDNSCPCLMRRSLEAKGGWGALGRVTPGGRSLPTSLGSRDVSEGLL